MILSFAHLKDWCVGTVGQWAWCRQVMLIIVMMMIVIEKAFGVEDCVVLHIEEGRSSNFMPLQENLTIGFQRQDLANVFTGLHFVIEAGKSINTISFNGTHALCSQDGLPQTTGRNLSQIRPPQGNGKWTHIRFSVHNGGEINIGEDINVCPDNLLPDTNKFFRIRRTDNPINVVFKCKEGCPIYNDTSVLLSRGREIHLPNTAVFVKRLRKTASAEFRLKADSKHRSFRFREECFHGGSCGDHFQDPWCLYRDGFYGKLTSPSETNIWKKMTFDSRYNGIESEVTELKVGEDTIWNNIHHRHDRPLYGMPLTIHNSDGMEWAFDCEPPSHHLTGETSSTAVLHIIIILPILFIIALAILVFVFRNKMFSTCIKTKRNIQAHPSPDQREEQARINDIAFVEGEDNYMVPIGTNQPAQGPQSPTTNVNEEIPVIPAQPQRADVRSVQAEVYNGRDEYVDLTEVRTQVRSCISPELASSPNEPIYANM